MNHLLYVILGLGGVILVLSLFPTVTPVISLEDINEDLGDLEANASTWEREDLQEWSYAQERRISCLEDLLGQRDGDALARESLTALESARRCNELFSRAIDLDVSTEAQIELGRGVVHGELAGYWYASSLHERENGNMNASHNDLRLARDHANLARKTAEEYESALGVDLHDRSVLVPKLDLAVSLTIAFMIGLGFIYVMRDQM